MTTYQVIKKHLLEQASDTSVHGYIDYISVGNGGMRFDSLNEKNFLGSVANSVMRANRMNVLFVA
jgi:hypothetical protein